MRERLKARLEELLTTFNKIREVARGAGSSPLGPQAEGSEGASQKGERVHAEVEKRRSD